MKLKILKSVRRLLLRCVHRIDHVTRADCNCGDPCGNPCAADCMDADGDPYGWYGVRRADLGGEG